MLLGILLEPAQEDCLSEEEEKNDDTPMEVLLPDCENGIDIGKRSESAAKEK